MTFLKTNAKITSTNYPYGRNKCTATWELEFKAGKGFRVVFQTINPKTQRLNAPKKSTYSPVILLTQNEITGHTESFHLDFNGVPELNKGLDFMTQHFDLFTPEQITDIYCHIAAMVKVSWYAVQAYCGADKDKTKELFVPHMTAALNGFKNGGNNFQPIKIDNEQYEALKIPDYKPFKTQIYEIN